VTDNSNEPTRNLRPGQLPKPLPPPPTQHQPPYGGPGQPGQPGQYGQQPPPWSPPPTQIAPGPYPPQGPPQGPPPGYPPQGQPGGWPPPYGPPGGPGGPPLPPGGSGSGGKTGLVVGIVIVVLALVAGGAGWYFLLGPGRTDNATASGPPSVAPTVDPSIGPPDTLPTPEGGPLGGDNGGDVDVDVAVGECVTAGGDAVSGSAVPADCGSPEANYKVIGKAPTSEECPSDANATYFESLGSTELGALCLDVDWVQGDCFDLTLQDPQRVECSAPPGLNTVRVEEIVQGTSDPNQCAEGGFPYDERNFIVCLETL
jgi:hypothetical protein